MTFSEPVNVTGTPLLALNAGGATASYTGGTGTSTLTFTYTVVSGQSTYDLDYSSTAALSLNGGTIEDAASNTATLTLPATGSDGLATQNIVIAPVSDGFETGDFSALNWQLSSAGPSPANWTVQSSVVHSGSYAAESGAVGASSTSTLTLTLPATEPAGEFAFWRKVSSAAGSSLTFEIDGVSAGQWSGSVSWQQSFYWVPAAGGTSHTFTWIYSQGTAMGGSNAAFLDDVQFLPGTTLVVEGTGAASDQFTFNGSNAGNASNPSIVVGLNGENHTFVAGAAGNFTKYLFLGNGTGAAATLTASASGNSALLYANGTGQLNNSTAGYAVSVDGMASMHANGHEGDTVKFYDSPGNDTYYAYADSGGAPSSGMYGSGYSNSAAGFGTNDGYAINGGSDTAYFYDSTGNDTYYAYADYNNTGKPSSGMYGSYGTFGAYSDAANGFATTVASATNGGSDTAYLYGSPGNDTYYAYADYGTSGAPSCGMYGSFGTFGAYSDSTSGFGTNIGTATSGGSNTAYFLDSTNTATYYAYADYNNTAAGLPSSGMYGSYKNGANTVTYANAANGFTTNVGLATAASHNDTAYLYHAPGSNTYYAYTDYNGAGSAAGMIGSYGGGYANSVSGFGTNIGNEEVSGGSDTAYLYDSQGGAMFSASASNYGGKPSSGMNGSGTVNLALGFATNVGYAFKAGDTAYFYDSPGSNTFYVYPGQESAGMYGSYGGGYANSASGFTNNIGYATSTSDTAYLYGSPTESNTYYAYANSGGQSVAGIYGAGYSSSANGFTTNLGYSTSGSDTAYLYGLPTGSNSLNADAAIAELYGSNYGQQASGFAAVTVTGGTGVGVVNTDAVGQGQNAPTYQLNLVGSWVA